MNVFATYACPVKSARALDDQRVVKMMTESCQILSTCASKYGYWKSGMPKPTHKHHPIVVWAGEGADNWVWLWNHAHALEKEWQRRWNHDRRHKTILAMEKAEAYRVLEALPAGATPHANCARNSGLGIDFTWVKNPHKAYRRYLIARWLIQKRPAQCKVTFEASRSTVESEKKALFA